jgi:hypothetical protein
MVVKTVGSLLLVLCKGDFSNINNIYLKVMGVRIIINWKRCEWMWSWPTVNVISAFPSGTKENP